MQLRHATTWQHPAAETEGTRGTCCGELDGHSTAAWPLLSHLFQPFAEMGIEEA